MRVNSCTYMRWYTYLASPGSTYPSGRGWLLRGAGNCPQRPAVSGGSVQTHVCRYVRTLCCDADVMCVYLYAHARISSTCKRVCVRMCTYTCVNARTYARNVSVIQGTYFHVDTQISVGCSCIHLYTYIHPIHPCILIPCVQV